MTGTSGHSIIAIARHDYVVTGAHGESAVAILYSDAAVARSGCNSIVSAITLYHVIANTDRISIIQVC
jgi:hypothetical protein